MTNQFPPYTTIENLWGGPDDNGDPRPSIWRRQGHIIPAGTNLTMKIGNRTESRALVQDVVIGVRQEYERHSGHGELSGLIKLNEDPTTLAKSDGAALARMLEQNPDATVRALPTGLHGLELISEAVVVPLKSLLK